MTLLAARAVAVTPPGADRPAITGVSLEVSSGEWLAVTGANGSGKSSLAMALAGLWPVSDGEVRLRGTPFVPGDGERRREVAVIFQEPSSQLLQPSVREELAFSARNLDLPEAHIGRSLGRLSLELGLASELDRDPRTLSAGRQQLLLLGAALVADPALLIADEPGAHLDGDGRARALATVRSRVRDGLAVIWITQDEAERAAADREHRVGAPPGPDPAGGAPAPVDRQPCARPRIEVEIDAPPDSGPAVRIPELSALRLGPTGLHAVRGPNGSGKTVLLSAIAGLRPVPQVRVRWLDAPDWPPIMATQFPELQIFEERVGDEIAHAARRRGMPDADIQRTISQHLTDFTYNPAGFLDRRCWSLSAGEKRLVGILGAVLAPASLVVLDEPTAGLDPAMRAAIGRLVTREAARVPFLVATQDLEWVLGSGGSFQGSG